MKKPLAIPDEDLDDFVAQMVLEESRAKNRRYDAAFYAPPSVKRPQTNKRFLSSIIKNTDSFNASLARNQRAKDSISRPTSHKASSSRSREPTRSSDRTTTSVNLSAKQNYEMVGKKKLLRKPKDSIAESHEGDIESEADGY